VIAALVSEAERVRDERAKSKQQGKPENKWPHAERAADCERFLLATPAERAALLKRIKTCPNSFNIAEATTELAKLFAHTVPKKVITELSKQILAWWDRQVVEALTGERGAALFAEEVRSEVTKRAAALHKGDFFDDTDTYLSDIAPLDKSVMQQLDLIDATQPQRKRVQPIEAAARAQRAAWMRADILKTVAIQKYDGRLIQEWSYHFDENVDKCNGASSDVKMSNGRELLNWSHFSAPLEVPRIDSKYDNPDFIRGSYLYLSGQGAVGWHPDYVELMAKLIKKKAETKK